MIELILFVIAMASIFALLISLMYMNWLINTLYELGLTWVSSYYSTIRLSFALLSVLVITLLSLVILHRRTSKAKVPGVEIVAYSETLMKRVQDLRLELWRYKRKPSVVAGNVLLFFGVIAFSSSVIYESSVLAFIGLGLTFWGVLFSFIRPTRYVRSSLLDSTGFSSLATVDRVLADLRYEGRGVYLPPRYLKGLKRGTVFIPSKKDLIIPTVEEVTQGKVFLKNPEGICLTAPGLGLVNLFERELGTSFAKVDLEYLRNNLPKLFIEGLEIAEDFKMNTQSNIVHVRITGSIYNDLCKEVRKLPNANSIGCPLCSSIACALARSTGKPVIIENNKVSEDGKVIEAYYRTLGANQSTDFPLGEQTVWEWE